MFKSFMSRFIPIVAALSFMGAAIATPAHASVKSISGGTADSASRQDSQNYCKNNQRGFNIKGAVVLYYSCGYFSSFCEDYGSQWNCGVTYYLVPTKNSPMRQQRCARAYYVPKKTNSSGMFAVNPVHSSPTCVVDISGPPA